MATMAAMAAEQPGLKPSALVPRRLIGAPSNRGRRSPNYPNLNFQAIGRALGVAGTYVGRILNGRSRPSLRIAEKLAGYMGCSIDQINALYKRRVQKQNQKRGKK